MITCCEVAITLAITNMISLAVFAGYTVHWKERTLKLEQKNGKELAEIEKLKKDVENLRQVSQSLKSSQKLKTKKARGDKN